jgi:hypothetical protein
MSEFVSTAGARAVIFTNGFDQDMMQHALAQAGDNE